MYLHAFKPVKRLFWFTFQVELQLLDGMTAPFVPSVATVFVNQL